MTDLENEEKNRMAVWAEAMRTLNNADEKTDLNLVLKVINENNTIPVVVLDSQGNAQVFRNVTLSGADFNDSLKMRLYWVKTFFVKEDTSKSCSTRIIMIIFRFVMMSLLC